MPDDRKDEEITKPQPSDGAPENLPPFVPNDDSANFVALSGRIQMAGRGALTTNAGVFPPLLAKTVRYVDFGFTSAKEFWVEVVLPAYECFKVEPSRGKAMIAALAAWHIQDWIWHDQHPGEDTRDSKDYKPFQERLFVDCPELPWIRDVADAAKHRGLGRKTVEVREVKSTWPLNAAPSTITLDDGTQHDFADVLARGIEYWRRNYFP